MDIVSHMCWRGKVFNQMHHLAKRAEHQLELRGALICGGGNCLPLEIFPC